jgi:hypothetical protein
VDLPASLSYELPERLSASHYQEKLDRALAGASARGDATADAARDVAPPTAADEAADVDADAEAYVRGWTEALAVAADAPDGAAAAAASAAAPRRAAAIAAAPPAAAAAAATAPAANGGATFYFDVLAEGTFGAGVRGDESDPSQPRGGSLTNMGQFSYGELKCVREAGDAGPDADADEEEEEEEEDAEAEVEPWEEDSAAEDEVEEEEEEEDDDEEGEADEAQRRVAQRVDAAGEASGSDSERDEDGGDSDNSGVSGDSGEDGRPGRTRAPKLPATRATLTMPGAHPLFEMPTKDMRPTLSPFLQARRVCAPLLRLTCSDGKNVVILSVLLFSCVFRFFCPSTGVDGARRLGHARDARLPGQPAGRARVACRRRRSSCGRSCAQHVSRRSRRCIAPRATAAPSRGGGGARRAGGGAGPRHACAASRAGPARACGPS